MPFGLSFPFFSPCTPLGSLVSFLSPQKKTQDSGQKSQDEQRTRTEGLVFFNVFFSSFLALECSKSDLFGTNCESEIKHGWQGGNRFVHSKTAGQTFIRTELERWMNPLTLSAKQHRKTPSLNPKP